MGFRSGSYAKVFSVEPAENGKTTKLRIAISRKNKTTDQYEQDFGGFVTCIGEANTQAKNLKEGDRIKLVDCDLSNRYNAETKRTYWDPKIFSFEFVDGAGGGAPTTKATGKKVAPIAEDGEVDEDDNIPF